MKFYPSRYHPSYAKVSFLKEAPYLESLLEFTFSLDVNRNSYIGSVDKYAGKIDRVHFNAPKISDSASYALFLQVLIRAKMKSCCDTWSGVTQCSLFWQNSKVSLCLLLLHHNFNGRWSDELHSLARSSPVLSYSIKWELSSTRITSS